MGVRKQGEQNIRKLIRLGGRSLVVSLPMSFVKILKWKEKQKLVVKKVRSGLLIKDWKK